MRYAGKVLIFILFVFFNSYSQEIFFKKGKVYFVSSEFGDDDNSGLSSKKPLKHIQKAINKAHAGDTIIIMPGQYYENIKTVRDGQKNLPITIIGTPDSIIYGNDKPMGKIFYIHNSYIHIFHLKINGQFEDCFDEDCYHDKLIYIKGSPDNRLKGIKIISSEIKNAMGECLRIKYTDDSEIGWNKISHCGIRDFVLKLRKKQNGEGIYVGTAPEQADGRFDKVHNLYIHHNTIATYGSECIDIKEYSYNIKIKNNVCLKNQAYHVGGISIRGNNNLIEGNIVFDNEGAGIRLGGDTEKDGIMNKVIGNYLDNNTKTDLKIMRTPQNEICGNKTTSKKKKRIYPKNSIYKNKAFKPCN